MGHNSEDDGRQDICFCKVAYFLWPEMWKKQLDVESGTVLKRKD
jgi:hypothetical protein